MLTKYIATHQNEHVDDNCYEYHKKREQERERWGESGRKWDKERQKKLFPADFQLSP